MTNLPTTYECGTKRAKSQEATSVFQQLEALFNVIPEEELLKALKVYYAGRNGYTYKVLWRTYIAMVVLNLPSFAALIRALRDNPYLAIVCGINNLGVVPSKFAYSRFMKKLQTGKNVVQVKNIMRNLTRRCYDTFPDFGKSVAIDATDLKAWSNGGKKHKTDPDAGWVIKAGSNGCRKFVYGYKMHLLCDATYEIPMAAIITKGNMGDVRQATPLLSQARYTIGSFHPEYVLCDAAYSSLRLRRIIKSQFRAKPIIKSPKNHRWVKEETPEWKLVFNQRVAVERVFGRMKSHRRLNNITVRRKRKVTVHSLIPVIVAQAAALAFPKTPRNCILS